MQAELARFTRCLPFNEAPEQSKSAEIGSGNKAGRTSRLAPRKQLNWHEDGGPVVRELEVDVVEVYQHLVELQRIAVRNGGCRASGTPGV